VRVCFCLEPLRVVLFDFVRLTLIMQGKYELGSRFRSRIIFVETRLYASSIHSPSSRLGNSGVFLNLSNEDVAKSEQRGKLSHRN